jgi:site-specific recombinase XerD
MQSHHPDNERIKRRYLTYLKEARGFSEESLDQVAMALHRYETYTKFRDFRTFHVEQVRAFKQHLRNQRSRRTGESLSHATIYSTLGSLKAFFMWVAGQPGFKSRFSFGDWDYFSPSGITASVAKAHRGSRAPTLDQIRRVLSAMPLDTEIHIRDRALIAFVILTGARDRAVASFRLRHLDLAQRWIAQDSRVVKTKFRKTFTTWFFPVGDDIEQIVAKWARFLIEEKLWGLDDPLFPATRVIVGATGHFEPAGLDRKQWSDAGPIRTIFKRAFEQAGLPYSNPHSFRNTLVALGRDVCKTWAEMQAWAQNLGHESLTTTFGCYGKIADHQQGELIRNAGKGASHDSDKLDRLLEMIQRIQPSG